MPQFIAPRFPEEYCDGRVFSRGAQKIRARGFPHPTQLLTPFLCSFCLHPWRFLGPFWIRSGFALARTIEENKAKTATLKTKEKTHDGNCKRCTNPRCCNRAAEISRNFFRYVGFKTDVAVGMESGRSDKPTSVVLADVGYKQSRHTRPSVACAPIGVQRTSGGSVRRCMRACRSIVNSLHTYNGSPFRSRYGSAEMERSELRGTA